MPSRIEDYALIGDCQAAALVGRDGSIDWLCVPRFDSAACFAALLGTPEDGRWLVGPRGGEPRVRRRYREGTLVLETEFETDAGTVALIDFMPPRSEHPDLVRIVEGRRGRVPMRMELVIRFDYGSVVPWVRRVEHGIAAIAGPDMLALRTDVPMHGENLHTVADFEVAEGQRVAFDLTWHPSHRPRPAEVDAARALEEAESWWREWSGRCDVDGEWCEAVRRSLITLKALTYAPTGGIVAAPTTSLPECLGGVRNWDYRYCWLRDATFTLYALMLAGYRQEAAAWREWLLRAVAGTPSRLQIMYGLAGERRLTEQQIPWLPGYEGSAPVRVGNGAWDQHQLDVYGEVIDALHQARRFGLEPDGDSWRFQRALMDFLESDWRRPDEGIWEVRGPRRQFTHSKVMAWVAFDRAVKGVEQAGLDGPVGRWRAIRDEIHAQVCAEGFDASLGSFVQSYGSKHLDASLLMMPLVGFLPATDPRVRGTVEAIERGLVTDGFVHRYRPDPGVDGLPPGEGTFLLCTFWLADCLALMGRRDDARAIFERLLAIRNDVGLLSEGYDPQARRMVGNFPQAFSHIGLINTAYNLMQGPACPASDRPGR
ncbi:Trehalase [Aquisphaera giovannonii]|uniref:Trehalase n=1 Tax=Aquisphaera giovannonii TaxID=406548 RepID=A0A5B9W6R9_9BACT|nr:glycoside hydrolase family 15 protein [Aquisphaera giovannonii]QEH35924.1 Trehalase [Aquisphaera giovannonii]